MSRSQSATPRAPVVGPVVIDVSLALVLAVVVAVGAAETQVAASVREPLWLSGLVAVLVAGPIAVARHRPRSALAVAMAATAVSLATGVIPLVAVGAPLGAIAVTLYLVGRVEPGRRSTVAVVACLAVLVGVVLIRRATETPVEDWLDTVSGLGFGAVVLAAGWTLGRTARVRAQYAERAAAQATQRAVAEERLRIARELHDIVAHSLSLIAVQAGIGNHVAATRPAEAGAALRVIESTSRASLTEMRQLLGVLRSDGDGAGLAPAPGVAALPDLAVRAEEAGVSVAVDVGPGELPEGVGLSVYRIVQESVTNVVRHAAPARCRVTVAPTATEVRVEIVNDGPVVRVAGTGHGLAGMRERVAVYGGTFSAEPRPEGGFRVAATIPFERS